jgi:hypothetical protein
LGQARIKDRNWAIAAVARGVSMAVKAPIMKKNVCQSLSYMALAKTMPQGQLQAHISGF